MKEIRMYDNTSETPVKVSKANRFRVNRLLRGIWHLALTTPFVLGFLLTVPIIVGVIKISDIPRVPEGYVPAVVRYGNVIIENHRMGIKVRNGHVYEGSHHANDCPCHFTGKDSVNNTHVYDKLIEAVRYYDAHPGIEWYVRDNIRR